MGQRDLTQATATTTAAPPEEPPVSTPPPTQPPVTKGRGIFIAHGKNKKPLEQLKKILEQFGGEIKQSSSNVGMKDGRQMYRMSYSIRLPYFQRGDFISFDDLFYYISSIHKEQS